jgi:hypothetical protein
VMKKLDSRGVAALEFCIVAVPFFTLMFAIFDLGRYAITMQSLRMLASAEAREMMIKCYTPAVISAQLPTDCTADASYLSDSDRQTVAPFLYTGGLTPTLGIACVVGTGTAVTPTPTGCTVAKSSIPPPANGALVVTASQSKFTMIMPIWGGALDKPSASTQVAF